MVKNLLFLLILLIICITNNYYENYYTFFRPYYNQSVQKQIKLYNYKNHNYTFSTYYEISDLMNNLFTLIIKNTNILNIRKKIIININENLKLLNDNNINFSIIPLPLIQDYYKYSNLRYLLNINKSTIYFLYNKYFYKNINNINDFPKNMEICIYLSKKHDYSITNQIINLLFKNFNFKYKIIDNIHKFLKNKNNAIIFISSNPSDLLQYILNRDIKNKINILDLNLNDLNIFNFQITYIDEYIKFKKFSFQYSNFKYKTISFLNSMITNKYISEKIIYELVNYIYKNINNNNLEMEKFTPIDISYKKLIPFNVNLIHKGAMKFYEENNI